MATTLQQSPSLWFVNTAQKLVRNGQKSRDLKTAESLRLEAVKDALIEYEKMVANMPDSRSTEIQARYSETGALTKFWAGDNLLAIIYDEVLPSPEITSYEDWVVGFTEYLEQLRRTWGMSRGVSR